jgi:DNA polymerase-3 subunit gamma/tau
MSYLVLARKYRPTTFEQVIGQEGVVRTLKNAIERDRVAHAYLFTGARGVGKTTVARILAKALNCQKGPTAEPDIDCSICQEIARGVSPDVFEIDGASNTGVDDVRSLRENSQYMPAHSRFKIYIIDEVHMLSTNAFNALLKILEEPPAHVKFIFATTEPHKIPITVLSRCQRFDFKRISSDVILAHLRSILDKEGVQIETEGLQTIARQAGGSMRDAQSLTDQVLAFGGDPISDEQVRQALGLANSSLYRQVIQAIIDQQPDPLMTLIAQLFDEGHDLKRFLEGLVWHVHHLILFSSLRNPGALIDLLEEEKQNLKAQATQVDSLRWHQIFDVLCKTINELGYHPYPRLALETALLRLSAIEPVMAIDDLVTRVEHLAKHLPQGTSHVVGQKVSPPPPKKEERPFDQDKPTSIPPHPTTASVSKQNCSKPAQAKENPKSTPLGQGLSGQAAWSKLVTYISGRRPSLASFLSHAHPRQVETGHLCISFEPGSFFADQISSDRNQKELKQLCSDFFGQPCSIRIDSLSSDDGFSLAESREKANQETEQNLQREAREHPMVKEAIRVLGAKIDSVETHPNKKEGSR